MRTALRGEMDCFVSLAMTREGAASSRSCVGNDSLFEN
jgi:hypothetical protein